MRNLIFTILLLLVQSLALQSQSLYHTDGAQCDSFASGGCRHYQSPCPPEATAEIVFVLRTDQNGAQTSWEITDETAGSIVGQGANLTDNTVYRVRLCAFVDHCYRFQITDSGQDGIAAPGGYALYWNGDPVRAGDAFGATDTAAWGGCCPGFSLALKGGLACIFNADGVVFAEIEGGTPPFQYDWSTGATHTSIQAVAAGDDEVALTVTDAAGCTASAVFSPAVLAPLAISVETTPAGAPNTGAAAAVIASGVPPFTYAWSNGGQTASIGNLPEGNYSVTVADASGCTAEAAGSVLTVSTNQTVGRDFDLRCFPNPAEKRLNVAFAAPEGGQGILQIANASGALVRSFAMAVQPGENVLELDLGNLPAGHYWVSLQIGAQRAVRVVQLTE